MAGGRMNRAGIPVAVPPAAGARENRRMPSLSLVFAGSPAAAVPSLRALAASGHILASVITRADSPQGRRAVLTPTPVADAAADLGIPVIKANRLAGDATERVKRVRPDLGVIVAYGGLVREPLLSMPRLGWINLHFSLLPRWRGAAPVQRAIIAGDRLSGATVFQLVPELDAGDIYGSLERPLGAHETAGSALESLAVSGADLLLRVVDGLADGSASASPQAGDVTFAPKLTLDDGHIDWTHDADRVLDLFRGVTPEPGASIMLDGVRLKVIDAARLDAVRAGEAPRLPPGQLGLAGRTVLIGTATEPIHLITVHPAGRRAMAAADWWRGRPTGSANTAE